jgi:hypothetical protein
MAVDRDKIAREIIAKISRDDEPRRGAKKLAEEVKQYIQTVTAPRPGPDHPYSQGGPGSYVESIKVSQDRIPKGEIGAGRFLSTFTVSSDHPNANFIEFGTGPDKPGSRSPWGPNTPTPEFAPFGRAAHHFGGTAP